MRSEEKVRNLESVDDLKDISLVQNLLELQSRLKVKTDSIEDQNF